MAGLCMLEAGKLDTTAAGVWGGPTKGSPSGAGSAPPAPPAPGRGSLSRGRAWPTPTPPASPLPPGRASGKRHVGKGTPHGRWQETNGSPAGRSQDSEEEGPSARTSGGTGRAAVPRDCPRPLGILLRPSPSVCGGGRGGHGSLAPRPGGLVPAPSIPSCLTQGWGWGATGREGRQGGSK